MKRIGLTVHPNDNVTTLLDFQVDATQTHDGLPVAPGIPFGHKVARCQIARGQSIIKYGVAIGIATEDIGAGEHVHVHNCQ
jgi:altronate dehydratase